MFLSVRTNLGPPEFSFEQRHQSHELFLAVSLHHLKPFIFKKFPDLSIIGL